MRKGRGRGGARPIIAGYSTKVQPLFPKYEAERNFTTLASPITGHSCTTGRILRIGSGSGRAWRVSVREQRVAVPTGGCEFSVWRKWCGGLLHVHAKLDSLPRPELHCSRVQQHLSSFLRVPASDQTGDSGLLRGGCHGHGAPWQCQ